MDSFRFDRIVRSIAGAPSRREMVRALVAGGVAVVLGNRVPVRAEGCGDECGPCGPGCPSGQLCTGVDPGSGEGPTDAHVCCAPDLVFRVHATSDERFCCPAEQVCPSPNDLWGVDAHCCRAGEVCVAEECCEADRVCGGVCCRDTVCVDGACVCPPGELCVARGGGNFGRVRP